MVRVRQNSFRLKHILLMINLPMPDPVQINRYAVTLVPTEAFREWVNSWDDTQLSLEEIQKEPTVFLLSESGDDLEKPVRKHFKEMLLEELNTWYTDPDMWPKDLSYKTFKKFFTVHVTSMVFDLGKGRIEKEED